MLNDHSITSPHNEPQRSPGFAQKQPPELFCRKTCSQKFHKFPRKTPELESLFNSVASRNFICERLFLFVSPQKTITNSSGEFGLDETSKISIFLKRTEAVALRCSVKKVFLEISQIHRKTPVPESLF